MKLSITSFTRSRPQKARLSKRGEALVTAHWSNLQRCLAPPVAAWEWGESGLCEPLKHKLKARGLIRKSNRVTGHWETSEKLWMHVIERAGDDETVGDEATGQLTLDLHVDVPRSKPGEPRVKARQNHTSHTSWSVQESLTGDAVPMEDLQTDDIHPRYTDDRWRDPTKPTGREKAARHPAQSSLEPWSVGRRWVVNPASNVGVRVAD